MSATAALFALAKSPRAVIALIGCGVKVLRLGAQKMGVVGEAGDVQNGLLEVISSLGGNLAASQIDKRLDAMPPQQLEQANQHLVHFTGLVLQALVAGALEEPEFAVVKKELVPALDKLPEQWAVFVQRGVAEAQPMAHQDFVLAIASVLEGHDPVQVIEPALLSAFFAQWLNHCVSDVIGREGWHVKLAEAIAPGLGSGMAVSLVTDHPAAEAAFKKSLLRFHTEALSYLKTIDTKLTDIAVVQQEHGQQAQTRHIEVTTGLSKVEQMLVEQTAPGRRAAYLRSLLAAFSAYQELALDNYAAADQTAPDIWDIFVHPACAKEHLRPEDMDKAQLETPPRLPAEELLPILGSETERRHVLLADPGMGKSTLVQSLIALIASGRSIVGAPALTGLLPVPFILRDLVPLLPQGEPEAWDWNSLLEVLIKTYRREENAPPLFQAWQGYEPEFRDIIHSSDQVFFLVDGLDEIGDLRKRKKIVQAIQQGIRATNVKARWLITSRVIGYHEAMADVVKAYYKLQNKEENDPADIVRHLQDQLIIGRERLREEWGSYGIGVANQTSKGLSEAIAIEHIDDDRINLDSGDHSILYSELAANYLGVATLPIARLLYLAPFDDQRQDLFTQRWFRHRHSTDYSTVLMREVRQHGHEGVRVIARVPNLLCMMNMLKRSGKPLPDGRAALYDEIVKAYLGGIESTFRNREAIGLTCPLSAVELRHLLALLGAHMQQTRTDGAKSQDRKAKMEAEGSILISQPEIEKLLAPVIQTLLDGGKVTSPHNAHELLQELLNHIARRSGLLIPRSVDAEGQAVYGFTHLSFLEFFAAEWLGKEFDRHRNRLARKAEAAAEDQDLSDADLDREFPASGPIQHQRKDFPELAANPSWHEPLIFLLESRPGDASTLLRWLFPALHPGKQPTRPLVSPPRLNGEDELVPLMPLIAVGLAVKLAQDKELQLSPDTLHRWWRILWTAQLQWNHAKKVTSRLFEWQIAPMLLEREETQPDVMAVLTEAWSDVASALPAGERPSLFLKRCHTLNSRALQGLARLVELERLHLDEGTGLDDTNALAGLKGLRMLSLSGCTGLQGSRALQGLAGLVQLERLYLDQCMGLENTDGLEGLRGLRELNLSGCTGLQGGRACQGFAGLVELETLDLIRCTGLVDTDALAGLKSLRRLYLSGCIGLKGRDAMRGLAGLVKLKILDLSRCTGLKIQEVEALKKNLGPGCSIYWP